MPIVDRFFAQLQPGPENSESTPQPLAHYYSYPAIVILGDPGSGKTTCLRQSATAEPNAVFITVRDFLALRADQWEGKTLYLDGLDEQRAKTEDGRGALDRLRGRLDSLNKPRYRLSCRAADWYGGSETERLRAVSPDADVLVLRLEPLSDEDITSIAGDELADPADFLAQAQRRGIDPLLRNPQTLELILKEVRDGVWPATRADLYRQACERLLQETNPEHVQGQAGYVPTDKLVIAAGYLCAVHLCGGTKGIALSSQDADEDYPFIGEMRGNLEVLASAARRRLFRADGQGRSTPIHRTIAEYLAARFIVHRLRAGHPLKRILALLTGYDGGTLAELRGIYAWLACLCEEEAATLIRRDPLGLVLYGDASILSASGRRMLIDSLRDLAIRNPGFRADNWSSEPFGALASPDLVPVFARILNDQTEPPHLLGCILDAIAHGPPLPELCDALMKIVRDHSRPEGARVSAFEAFLYVRPNDRQVLQTLLIDIHQGRVLDEHHRLRGKLLYALYPRTIGPHEIAQFLVQEVEHHVNAYTMFVAQDLVGLTKPDDLPILISGIDATKMTRSPHHLIWKDFCGRLILQILRHHGESSSSPQLYDWLGKVLDQYGSPVADREEQEAIKNWLMAHPAVVQGLFRQWLSVISFEKPRVEVMYFWKRLYSIDPPEGFHRCLLHLAESEADSGRAEFLFREAVQGSTSLLRKDGPTLEELFEFAVHNPRFLDPLRTELCWDIPSWRREDAQHKRERQQKEEANRAIRLQQLSEQLEAIRSGTPTNALVYLAKIYFGLFYDLDRESQPRDRLTAFTTPEIAATALDGFVAALQRPDIPSPKMIGELEAESKEYIIGFPVLAGLDVLASNSFADVLSLPELTLQSGLAFHYANLTERKREWVDRLIESLPNLAADALAAYWRPHLARDSKHIPGLYELAHEEVMKPIAQRVSLILLKDYANSQEDNLQLLLHAATRNGDPTELVTLARNILADTSAISDENRTLWYAVAFVLDHNEVRHRLANHIGERKEQAARLLTFLCPSLGIKSGIQYPLSLDTLVSLIALTGPLFHPKDLGASGWLGLHSSSEAATLVRSLIYRLGKNLTHEAAWALAQLHNNPSLAAWRGEIAYILADQARQRREFAFKYPSVLQVIETMNQGRPANAADLQALVSSHLLALRAELRDGPTDGWKSMWNVDSYGRPTEPRPENDCRDRLLELLRLRLLPLGVVPEPEGHFAEDKRADIKVIIGSLNLPVEIKRHYHEDLWTAPCEQLKKLYARDPGTAGRGIYLVLWFGVEVSPAPSPPPGSTQARTPSELEEALIQALTHSDRESIEIIIIDCARPQKSQGESAGPPTESAVKKLRNKKRS